MPPVVEDPERRPVVRDPAAGERGVGRGARLGEGGVEVGVAPEGRGPAEEDHLAVALDARRADGLREGDAALHGQPRLARRADAW